MYVVGRYAPWLGHRSDVDVGCSNIGLLSAKTLENGDKGLKLGPAWLWKKKSSSPRDTNNSLDGRDMGGSLCDGSNDSTSGKLGHSQKISSRLDPHKKSILEPQR